MKERLSSWFFGLAYTVSFAAGIAMLFSAMKLWIEGGYGRLPALVAAGALGWMFAGLIALMQTAKPLLENPRQEDATEPASLKDGFAKVG